MRLSQYAFFELSSITTSAAEVTAALGIDPDEVKVRASRFSEPRVVPAFHRWKIVCREPGMSVDEQLARVVARLAPHAEAIGVVRRFHDEQGQNRLASAPAELDVDEYDYRADPDDDRPTATGSS